MKNRKLFLLIIATLLLGFIGTGALIAEEVPERKMLIVFYSHTGNAKFVAEQIHALTGAEMFELDLVDPYPEDYNETLERARNEREAGTLPSLQSNFENIAEYDVIFLGSPNWFGTLSLPVIAFLKSHDLSEKTIIPFITYGRGGFANTITDMKEHCPNAKFLEEFGAGRDDVRQSQAAIAEWLSQILN